MNRKILTKAFSYRRAQSNFQVNLFIKAFCALQFKRSHPKGLANNLRYQFTTSEDQQRKSQKKSQTEHEFDAQSSYFQILGIQPSATEQQIKQAYLEMVKKYHPDLSKQENASEKFQLIQKAYQVLSDPQQRSKHKQELKVPNPETYEQANELKQKFKNFKRKDSVPDEWQFTYRLFKKHYEEVDAKEKEYKRYPGQGNDYYVHKDEMEPSKKVYAQQIGMIGGAVGIIAGIYYSMKN